MRLTPLGDVRVRRDSEHGIRVTWDLQQANAEPDDEERLQNGSAARHRRAECHTHLVPLREAHDDTANDTEYGQPHGLCLSEVEDVRHGPWKHRT